MYDDGSGEAPDSHPETPSYAGPFCYAWADIQKEDLGSGYYLMWVDLPENIPFPGCYKFWISIWGVGNYPPQSGWGYHSDPIQLAPAVWGSAYFGLPFWTPGYDVLEIDHDMCFQLTTKPSCEPAIDVEKEVWDEKNGRWVDADTQNEAFDAAKCSEIQFRITVTNIGNCPLYNVKVSDMMHKSLEFLGADPEPDSFDEDAEWYYIIWLIPEMDQTQEVTFYINAHVTGDECTYDVNHVEADGVCYHGTPVFDEDDCWIHSTGGSKTFVNPILNFLQNHPNMFPLLQILLQKLGLF
jgi:hypothetical protein